MGLKRAGHMAIHHFPPPPPLPAPTFSTWENQAQVSGDLPGLWETASASVLEDAFHLEMSLLRSKVKKPQFQAEQLYLFISVLQDYTWTWNSARGVTKG